MPNEFRYHSGDSCPVMSPSIASGDVIEIGDLVTTTQSAGATAWQGTLDGTQAEFAGNFLGVALQRSRDGDTDPISVATKGRFTFDCDAAAFNLGDAIGAAQGVGNTLANQKVASVAAEASKVGAVAQHYATATTEVLVEISSNVLVP